MPDKLRVSVLFWEDRSEGGAERDEVVDEVMEALTEGGHQPSLLGIYDNLRELLDKIDEQRPDLIFNLCERFADNDNLEVNVIAVLQMLGRPFTGNTLLGMALRQDKTIVKKLLKFHDVPYPNFVIFDKHDLEFAGRMHFPFFVKPLSADASLGIDDSSLVTDYAALVERIGFIQGKLNQPALVEEYIEGREFYVGVLGNDPVEVLPVMELDFSNLPSGAPRIYGRDAKLDETSPQFEAVNAIVATDLTPETRARIAEVGREAAYALKVSDYARIDIRLSPDGIPLVLEVNSNPYLERTSAFALAALQAGMGYSSLVNRIVDMAMKRWEGNPFLEELKKTRVAKPKIRRKSTKRATASASASQPEPPPPPAKPEKEPAPSRAKEAPAKPEKETS